MLAKYGAMSKYGADIPIAVIGIAMKVFKIVINIVVGIILGAQPILGYNYGAKKLDRVKETFRIVLVSTIVVGLVSTLVFELCPSFVISLFGAQDELYMEFACLTFRIFLMFVTLTCTIKMCSIFFQAVGKPIDAAIVSLARDIILFVPLVIILPNFMGVTGALWAAPFADVIGIIVTIILLIVFFKNLNKEVKPIREGSAGARIRQLWYRTFWWKKLSKTISEVTGNEPPTYNCVGTSDGIANYKIMENRINKIKQNGTDAEIDIFERLPHGFGLGEGTIAEGWINNAVAFWERNRKWKQ